MKNLACIFALIMFFIGCNKLGIPETKTLVKVKEEKFESKFSIVMSLDEWSYSLEYLGKTYILVEPELILPSKTNIGIEVNSTDVIHSLYFPMMDVRIDGIPNFDNLKVINFNSSGEYYAECIEPHGKEEKRKIKFKVVSPKELDKYLDEKGSKAFKSVSRKGVRAI